MLKRINWGWRIAALYTSFVVFILYMVYRSVNMKTELVTQNYYEEELSYQTHIDKINRTKNLPEQLQWTVTDKSIAFNFPKQFQGKPVKANIFFYCPSGSKNDVKLKCESSNGSCEVPTADITSGAYQMKIDWSSPEGEFYNEGFININ